MSLGPRRYQLGMMFAHTCNIACRHCGIYSSPRAKARMRLEDAEDWVRQAAEHLQYAQVNFTGGEPLLFRNEHLHLIGLATDLGLRTRVVTNGFWATSVEKGVKFLTPFKDVGLSELNFSADKWHLEFQSADILRNALEVCRQLEYRKIISFVTNDDGDAFDQLAELYGLPRDQMLNVRTLGTDRESWKHVDPEKLLIFAGGLIGMGRAAEYPAEHRMVPIDMFPSYTGCHEIVNKPVVYPDGVLQACCCAGGKIEAFRVGSLHEHSLAELTERMAARPHFQFINDFGPRTLHRIVARQFPELERRDAYTSICEMCVRAVEGVPAEDIDKVVNGHYAEMMLRKLGLLPDEPGVGPPSAGHAATEAVAE